MDWSGEADADGHAIGNLRVLESIARAAGTDAAVQPGDRFGPLRVLEKLGEGASGEVFRAWDTRLEREVALKLLHQGDGTDARRFHEARLLARVRHPGVVTVHGVETFAGRVGLWTELVRGRTLAALVRENGPFDAAEAIQVGVKVSAALEALHAEGLVHGDVKAANVMREEDGRLVLLDFGAARTGHEAHEGLAGTPLYLAPEVLAGAQAPSILSDVYAAGVLLYFLVSGRHPVQAATLEGLRRAHGRGPKRLLEVRPELAADFAEVVERAIGPARDRPASATALRAALERLGRSRRRRLLPAAVIAAASIATLAAFTAGLTLWRTPRKPPEAVMPRDRPPVVTSAARLVSDEAPAPSVPSVASSPTPASPRVESRPEVLYLPAVATTPAPPAISTADRMRDEGERTLESDLRALSDGALDAEAAWNAYRGACVGRSTQMLATEGAWAGKVVRVPMEDTARCRSRRAAVDELVRPTRTRLHEAEEAARRAGVLPGRVRDLKLRYRVDSALWE